MLICARLAPIHILWAFRALYLHTIARPTFVSAKGDVQLLFLVSEHFRLNGTKSVNGIELSRLVEMMHRVALVRVHSNVRPSRPGSRAELDCAEIPVKHMQQGTAGQVDLTDGAVFPLWPDVNSIEKNMTLGSNGYLF
jgi:hypothetical protein